jgi:hypothetical protein
MQITREEVVAGHPAMQVRGFVRRFDGKFFMRSAVERVMQRQPEQAEKFINEMVSLELIEPTTPFDNDAAFEVAERRLAFANATAAKPIYRKTARYYIKPSLTTRYGIARGSKTFARSGMSFPLGDLVLTTPRDL